MDTESSSILVRKEWQQGLTGHLKWFLALSLCSDTFIFFVRVLNSLHAPRRFITPACSSKAMRSIDRAWQLSRAKNMPFPWELLGFDLMTGVVMRDFLEIGDQNGLNNFE